MSVYSARNFGVKLLSFILALIFLASSSVSALSQAQKEIYNSHIYYFDASCTSGVGKIQPGAVPTIYATYNGNKMNPSDTVIRDLLKAQAATKVPASVLLAQGAVESGDAGWWDKTKMTDTKTQKYSYFNGGDQKNLNEEYRSYDNNPNGHGPMQLDNWPGSYGGATGNYNDSRFAKFKKMAIDQFDAEDSLNPKKIGNIAMMWDTSILFAALIDAELVKGDPAKASTADWAEVLDDYGTLRGASASEKAKWGDFRDKLSGKLDKASVSADTAKPTGNIDGSVYMLGDSITAAAKDDLEAALKAANSQGYINGSDSRSITKAGTTTGFKTSGLDAVDTDKDRISSAGSVVIALGTNQRDADFEASVKKIVNKINDINSEANIYWVNIFSEGKGSDKIDNAAINKSLEKLASSEDFTIIDTVDKDIEVGPDKTHPTTKGNQTFANLVAGGIADTTSSSASAGVQCTCEKSGASNLSGSNNEEKIYNYLTGKGLTPAQAAGIMGNLFAESGFDPRSYYPSTTTDNPDPSKAFGIAQWLDTRQTSLKERADKANKPITDLGVQLDWLWEELTGGYKASTLDPIKATSDLTKIATIWNTNFEKSGVDSGPRAEKATEILSRLGSGGGGGSGTGSGDVACSTGSSGEVVGEYSLPVPKKWFSSNKDWFTKPHHDYPAADIPVPSGTKIFAVAKGKVTQTTQSGYGGGAGTHVFISDGNVEYGYFHGTPGSIKVQVGDTVKPGQLLMLSDNTGHSSGAHLHFQIKVSGTKHCPQNLLEAIGEGKTTPAINSLPTSGCS